MKKMRFLGGLIKWRNYLKPLCYPVWIIIKSNAFVQQKPDLQSPLFAAFAKLCQSTFPAVQMVLVQRAGVRQTRRGRCCQLGAGHRQDKISDRPNLEYSHQATQMYTGKVHWPLDVRQEEMVARF